MKHQFVIVAALTLLGFAGTPAADSASTPDEPRQCMLTRTVNNFHVIDRHHVVLMDRHEETFLLGTIRPGCWDLQRSPAIAIEGPSVSVCAGGTAILRVMDERCHIVRLEAVTSVDAAVSLVEERAEADDTGD